ncbi:tyrosine-type recombinase/integrase [Nocardia sp. alder85J]|uniref:tyrosine-type recombinase/integrase n=1 Tax=Nocardia sp. alder85J TaxID=2862949 RepID=UPI001CD6D24F|nr:site-specific integrase [Nocardia sp. alder85J]MCX4097674.1 site-specific integrase [Nocardia sp. alder85J]
MSDEVGRALQLIASRLGVAVADVPGGSVDRVVPTFSEYIATLRRALPVSTVRNYDSYWRVLEREWGPRRIDEPTTSQIGALVQDHRGRAVVRSNWRGGRGAEAHLVAAIRCLYKRAEYDKLIGPLDNPAANVRKPGRLPSSRHALTHEQVVAMGEVASTTGNDTELDALIVRIHIEAACRRSAAVALTVDDLDTEYCLIRLHEKGEQVRWQPISPLLMGRLVEHVARRGGPEATRQVLRYRSGAAITGRRYDHLTGRVREHLPWAARLQVSIHWVRHTTLTWVEREFGEAIARAYAGHAESGGGTTTPIYTKASIVEVAEALAALTGQRHPLARAVRHPLAPRSAGGRTL